MAKENEDYAVAMANLEAGCHRQGIASIKFRDGEMVMVSLKTLRELAAKAEASGQDRVMIFIANGPILEGAKA